MDSDHIKTAVQERYGRAARQATSGEPGSCRGRGCYGDSTDPISSGLYGAAELVDVPGLAALASLGCGTRRRWPNFASARPCSISARAEESTCFCLRRLAGRPEADRTAAYRCVLVLAHADRRAGDLVASGSLPGRILERRLGEQGFGYDPVFWSDDLADSLGRVSAAAKDGISHRLRAVAALMAQLASPTRSG